MMTLPPSEPPENERFQQVSQVLQALECRSRLRLRSSNGHATGSIGATRHDTFGCVGAWERY
jgi:hypothetical protein